MSRVVTLYSPFYKHKSFRSFRANFLFQLWKFFNCINCCKTKTNKKVRRFFIKISWFSKFIKIEFCWRLVFKIFSIHKPSLGHVRSHTVWARLGTVWNRTLSTNGGLLEILFAVPFHTLVLQLKLFYFCLKMVLFRVRIWGHSIIFNSLSNPVHHNTDYSVSQNKS